MIAHARPRSKYKARRLQAKVWRGAARGSATPVTPGDQPWLCVRPALLDVGDHAVELGLGQPRVRAQPLDQLVERAADVLEVLDDALRVQIARAAGRIAADLELA